MPYKDPAQQKARDKRYRAEHHEAIREREKKYYALNRERIKKRKSGNREKDREVAKQYRARNPARVKEWRRRGHLKNREARNLKSKEYYATHRAERRAYRKANRARILELKRASYHRNKEAILERRARRYPLQREKVCAKQKDYYRRNPHMIVKGNTIRRTRVRATVENGQAINHFIKLIRASKSVVCYYCKKSISGKIAHIEHVIPIARNGRHEVGNLCASCPPCNNAKHAKLLSEWRREGQQVLPI